MCFQLRNSQFPYLETGCFLFVDIINNSDKSKNPQLNYWY